MPRAKPPTVTVTLPELIALAKSINDERLRAIDINVVALQASVMRLAHKVFPEEFAEA